MTDTIFALSSGLPPAAIAVLRISGPDAGAVLAAVAGKLPPPRRASLAALHDPESGRLLDRALLLWFPGPHTATGEDLAELHVHGGRAVVRVITDVLARQPGLRSAEAGEFTRRALDNGRIDLVETEGLADLLAAETEGQRRQALALSGGALSAAVAEWQQRLLAVAARLEAELDFVDEADIADGQDNLECINNEIVSICRLWEAWLARPPVERLRDGVTVAIAGPPNAGKSTLLNALAGREAAITSPAAGTTRDIIEVPLAVSGVPFRLADMAGLHEGTGDPVEEEGMLRARTWIQQADLLLWLGPPEQAPDHPQICLVAAQADRLEQPGVADVRVSAVTGQGMNALMTWLVSAARTLLPIEGEVALNARHRAALAEALAALTDASGQSDALLVAESVRRARLAIDRIAGRAGTEAMLDMLFGRFCIGK